MNFSMRATAFLTTGLGLAATCFGVASRSSSIFSTTSPPLPSAAVTMSAAAVALQRAINVEAPHVNTTSVVTLVEHRFLHEVLDGMFPPAYAGELGLGQIWDPESGGTCGPTSGEHITAAATPSVLESCASGSSCSGTLAMSFTADGQQSPDGSLFASAGNAYNGCINVDDRSLVTDTTLTCDATGASILASGGASATIEATRQVYIADVFATL